MNKILTCKHNIVEVFTVFDDFVQLVNLSKKVEYMAVRAFRTN